MMNRNRSAQVGVVHEQVMRSAAYPGSCVIQSETHNAESAYVNREPYHPYDMNQTGLPLFI
jgi:hypothetical protein